MNSANSPLGKPLDRVDGPLKVTGKACYAAEAEVPGLLYGAVVSSSIARGRVTLIDAAAAEAAGDAETARVCRGIFEQEKEMAQWLYEHLPSITTQFLARDADPDAVAKR